jgi:hypothetical protein
MPAACRIDAHPPRPEESRMVLTEGTVIGPYRIQGLLGSGAMGEVYRATDSRLDREVAIKVLPERFATDPERLRRFDQEARTAGTLNHPNIVTVLDVGVHEHMPYVVSELLKGESLRDKLLAGPLPLRKAVDYGAQIARGLAAAHARTIIHRDLKPENLFVTPDGGVKILDFGLAKLLLADGPGGTHDSLAGTMTSSGMILGTVGYMAPEQARGLPAGIGSDLFALGCVLYEMITGARAFHRGSPVETMAAILNEDPPAFPSRVRAEAPALVALVLRCLEKETGERFESARDIAYGLTILASAAGDAAPAAEVAAPVRTGSVEFKRLTFRRGTILRARFTPDGHSVVYGAAWEGQPVETFWTHLGSPEGRSLGHPGTDLLSVGPTGELAVCLKRRQISGFSTCGTLARTPLAGGSARQLLQNVEEADWNPEGTQLAIVRSVDGANQLEYPMGKVLFRTTGWVSHPRVSRDGKQVAFIHHEVHSNDGGSVTLVDRDGEARVLSPNWGTIRGLAWSADGSEVWFTAHEEGAGRGLHAVALDGTVRVLHTVPGHLCVQDIFPDGRVLLTHSNERQAVMLKTPSDIRERDLSWLDWSLLRDVSNDGQWLLLSESGEGGGSNGAVCIRLTDGSPAVQLGEGDPVGFSPDGAWVLVIVRHAGQLPRLLLLPTGVGEVREVPLGELHVRSARFHPDGRSLLVTAKIENESLRLHRIDVETGAATAIGHDGILPRFEISPDGEWLAAKVGDSNWTLLPLVGGEARPIPGLRPDDDVQPWTADNGAVLVIPSQTMPIRIERLDLASGERTLLREVLPPDSAGVSNLRGFRLTPDGETYGYSYGVELHDLYLIEDLR